MPRMDGIVVGPGLGTDEVTSAAIRTLLQDSAKNVPLVIDADGLSLVARNPHLISDHRKCVLTPNIVEFNRIYAALELDASTVASSLERHEWKQFDKREHPLRDVKLQDLCKRVAAVSEKLGGVGILLKGPVDIAVAAGQIAVNERRGSPRRSGGQGDVLAGCIAACLAWLHMEAYPPAGAARRHEGDVPSPQLLAAIAGSFITRESARLAFERKGRSMTADDVAKKVGTAAETVFTAQ